MTDNENGSPRKQNKDNQISKSDLAKFRPENYDQLSPRDQWRVDKQLGILDWDGKN